MLFAFCQELAELGYCPSATNREQHSPTLPWANILDYCSQEQNSRNGYYTGG